MDLFALHQRRFLGLIPYKKDFHIEILYENPRESVDGPLVVVCHPNPLAQGTMYHKIPSLVTRTAHDHHLRTLRFQFSGAGLTTIPYENFEQQVELLSFLIEHMQSVHKISSFLLAGFSFGGACVLASPLVCPKFAIAPAWAFLTKDHLSYESLTVCHAIDDDIIPVRQTWEAFAALKDGPASCVLSNHGGHFFNNQADFLKEHCSLFLKRHY